MCLLVFGSVTGVAECLVALLEELAQERLLPRVASAAMEQNMKDDAVMIF